MKPWIFHISLYDLASITTLIAGLMLALLLGFAKKNGHKANLFLCFALAVTALGTGEVTALFLPALGPLLYFYVRQLTLPDRPFHWKDMFQFLLLIAGYWMPAWLVFISVMVYLYLGYRLIVGFYKRLQPVLMDKPRFPFRRLERTLLLLALFCALACVSNIFCLVIAFVLMGMSAGALLKPDHDAALTAPVADRSDAREKGRKLKEAVAANRLYEDAELTLATLALKLMMHPQELSRIINVGLGKNFSDFINEFRVREVTRKIKDPAYDRLTLPGIAYESGFNSKTTFNRVFKEITGKTPLEYKNGLKKKVPIDKMVHLRPVQPLILRQKKLARNMMFKNYVKIAWRNLIRNKASSLINIGGLAVGMAVAMLIGLWIWDELSYNTWHRNYDRIVQITQREKHLGETRVWEHLPYRLLDELRTNYGGDFRHIVIATEPNNYYISAGENKITQTGQYIDADAPEMLTLKMLHGTWFALHDPHAVLLSASAAKSLFGDSDPMDKIVKVSGTWDAHTTTDVKVTGVYEDLPQNTQFHEIQFVMPWSLFAGANTFLSTAPWDDHHFLIYGELRPGADRDIVSANIKDAELNVIRHMDDMRQEVAAKPEILLNPMKNWRLYSNFKNGTIDKGPVRFVWIVGIIGAFVLLLACINFMNLSTARSEKRAAEVGIRKAIGSGRGQLISQFFCESLLVASLAFALALLLTLLALPLLNDLSAKQLNMPFASIGFWLSCLIFIVLTGMLAGIYPAFYLSSFQPVKVLKGVFRAGRLSGLPRQILVVTQFTVSVVLIICTIVIYNQLIFAKSRPIGYSREGLLVVPMQSIDYQGKEEIIRNELKNTGAVAEVAESESALTAISSNNGGFSWKGKTISTDEKFGTLTVTSAYGKTVGWQFKDGRDFYNGSSADSSGFVINEAAAAYMGLKHPVGETIHWTSKWNKVDKDFTVIGVVKDMVMESPYDAARPVIFRLGGNLNWIFIRINPQVSVSNALPKIAAVFKNIVPSVPFTYAFADDEYAKKFTTEERIGKLTKFFSCLAIFISCLGLFGMTLFMAEQRTKEIGVRKVLGASVFTLWRLLSKDFLVLVTISLLVAAPVAWYFMSRWLQGYAYRTPISLWVFALTAIGTLLMTLLTVSYQCFRVALTNPVKSLRSE